MMIMPKFITCFMLLKLEALFYIHKYTENRNESKLIHKIYFKNTD